MGRNLALNLNDQNLPLVTYSYSEPEREQVAGEHPSLVIADSLTQFVAQLGAPRVIFLMVTAGNAVDEVIDSLLPMLTDGDVIIDGGNSFYPDTERRVAYCAEHGVNFVGVGVSGGAEGARYGASVMIGGTPESFQLAEPMYAGLACEVGIKSRHFIAGISCFTNEACKVRVVPICIL